MSPIPTIRRGARHVVVASASLVALIAVALFVVAPSSSALTLQASAAGKTSHGTEVLYGRFTHANGTPVKHGVRVSITKIVGHHQRHITTFSANSKGLYRKVMRRPKGTFRITVTERIGHKTYRRSRVMHLKPGHAYRLGGHISKHAMFSFLPVSTY